MWIINCWNGLFVSKPHQKGKVLYSSCSFCHVLTINMSPQEKWWQRPYAAMVKKSNWRKWNVWLLLVHNYRLDVKSFDFCWISQGGKFESVCFILKASCEMVLCLWSLPLCLLGHIPIIWSGSLIWFWFMVHLYDMITTSPYLYNITCATLYAMITTSPYMFFRWLFCFSKVKKIFFIWWGLTRLMSRITLS